MDLVGIEMEVLSISIPKVFVPSEEDAVRISRTLNYAYTTDCRMAERMNAKVTTYHLEMNRSEDLKPKEAHIDGMRVERVCIPSPELNRFFYVTVGQRSQWIDRLVWSEKDWINWAKRDELQTWVLYVKGAPAGYFELEFQDGNVEIAFFGLLPQFIGLGIGGHLLTQAVRNAWKMGAKRIWVHTCTLDHPHALANYQARGFKVFRQASSDSLPTL